MYKNSKIKKVFVPSTGAFNSGGGIDQKVPQMVLALVFVRKILSCCRIAAHFLSLCLTLHFYHVLWLYEVFLSSGWISAEMIAFSRVGDCW